MAEMASCRVYNRLVKFVGHVEQEGGYYSMYRGWTDFVGHVEQEGGYYTVHQAGVECVGRIKMIKEALRQEPGLGWINATYDITDQERLCYVHNDTQVVRRRSNEDTELGSRMNPN